jgi:hypothetical protein
MGGTAVLKEFVPTFDGTVVSKLRASGAVVLEKLNLSEGAAAGYNPSFDVPLNPWLTDRWPGMSWRKSLIPGMIAHGLGDGLVAFLFFAKHL